MLGYCGATDTGGRENNEDAYTALALGRFYLFAVADGLGGHMAGEVASTLAVEELSMTVRKGLAEAVSLESMKKLLAKGFGKANEEILHQANAVPERYGMGTTLVAALLNEHGKGIIANVGDSRAYIMGEKIARITRDHSYVQELVDSGVITQEEAAWHPQKNIVTRIIGMEGVEPDFYEVSLGGNILLLCSDGLTDAMSDREIREIVFEHGDMEGKCKNLVSAVLGRSARDNVTVVLAYPR